MPGVSISSLHVCSCLWSIRATSDQCLDLSRHACQLLYSLKPNYILFIYWTSSFAKVDQLSSAHKILVIFNYLLFVTLILSLYSNFKLNYLILY